MAEDPFRYFRPEAGDLVDQFARSMLDLEKGEGATGAVRKLLRLAHTLKGAARVVKQAEIANLAHAIEDTLSPHRDAGDSITREQIESVLVHLDHISDQVATLGKPAGDGAPALAVAEPERRPRTVRTDIAEADAVLESVAEAHALLNGLRDAVQGLAQMRRLSDLLVVQLATAMPSDQRPAAGGSQRGAIAEELRRKFGETQRDLTSNVDQMDRELRQLRETAERLRLVSAEALFTALERTARDIAAVQGKQVKFVASGGDIRLDAYVLEIVQGALIQIVRNAVAHGIEPTDERKACGKASAGTVQVKVVRRGRDIVFTCRDDGRGVGLDAVRRSAEQRGLLGTANAEADAGELMRMLLRGGISTSKTVTGMSGRGIGLDIVRESIERLGGEVIFDSKRGAGTTFELILPPSLASIDALIVEAGAGSAVSVPLDAVRGTLRVAAADISHGASGATVVYGNAAIPFMPLPSAFGGAPWPASRNWTAIVVAGAMGMVALGVDRLLGTGPTIVRTLPDGIAASAVVAGASLDSEGNPQLMIDPEGLVAAVYRGNAGKLKPQAAKLPLLVVDDSMTTRMLEKSILESAGYDVDVALSGEEALDCLRGKHFALILVDVEMPGMDGFTFIERLRSNPARNEIPAILVTSRASPEDLKRGRDVGANGHIVKSEFDQAELLATIERLTG